MYKPINEYENYIIYDNGDIFNLSTKNFLKGSVGENGYKYYRLSKNNKKQMFYAHRLVAEAFIENPNNLPVVNHIDGDKLNNNVNNLEWVNYSKNMEHFHQKIKKCCNQKQEKYKQDLPGEKWKIVKNNPNYEVSSCGRVHNLITNNILHPSETCGYYKVRLSTGGITTDWLVHKLVFLTFNPEVQDIEKMCIDHIDGNKHNNNINNLRLVTISENVKSAYYTQRTNSNIKPVNQFDKNNNLIATYPSCREAGRQLNLDSSSITKCCKGKLKTTGGFIFKYA